MQDDAGVFVCACAALGTDLCGAAQRPRMELGLTRSMLSLGFTFSLTIFTEAGRHDIAAHLLIFLADP